MINEIKCKYLLLLLHREIAKRRKYQEDIGKIRKKDFPAASVGCYHSGFFKIGYSHKQVDESLLEQSVITALTTKLGPIGKWNGCCKNKIGSCAENYTASRVMKHLSQQPALNQLGFTIALRPRTSQYMAYCANCQQIYG